MLVFGPMRDLEHPDKVHWMRAFATKEDHDRIKAAFYGSPVWNQQISAEVMPMIAHYDADVVETTEGFEGFAGAPTL